MKLEGQPQPAEEPCLQLPPLEEFARDLPSVLRDRPRFDEFNAFVSLLDCMALERGSYCPPLFTEFICGRSWPPSSPLGEAIRDLTRCFRLRRRRLRDRLEFFASVERLFRLVLAAVDSFSTMRGGLPLADWNPDDMSPERFLQQAIARLVAPVSPLDDVVAVEALILGALPSLPELRPSTVVLRRSSRIRTEAQVCCLRCCNDD